MAAMKTKMLVGAMGLVVVLTAFNGCVSTVTDEKKAAVPWGKDKVTGQYDRPVEQVFQAAKDVVKSMGTLIKEGTAYGTGGEAKIIEAKVNQSSVWIRAEPADKVTAVTVQVRTKGGAADMELAHEIDKQIAVKLVH